MELRDYLRVLRKSWTLILAVTIVGIGLGVGLTVLTTKIYQANVQIFASSSSAGQETPQGLNGGNSFVSSRVQSYTEFATSPAVLKLVLADSAVQSELKSTHRTLTEEGLAKKISADAPVDKVLINLHVTDTNPAMATVLANALGTAFDKVVPQTEQKIPVVNSNGKVTDEVPSVQLTVIHPATVPSSPIKPNKVLNIAIGLVVGLLIGIAVAVVREVLDNTVKSVHDLEELGVPLLAQIAFDKRASRAPIAFRSDAHSARAEAYRQLRTNLQFIDVDNPPRIISVTSPVPGEGKTTTAINLAAALAEAGGRVCLIEADLRRPSMAKSLGLVGDVGFTTVVIGKAPVETVLQNAGKNLAVLTCGPIPPNPSELLISQHAKQVILDIAEKVDFVIIDTPPLLPVADGAEIATIVDATLLVHRAGKTTRDQAMRAIEALDKVGRRPVGVILNMVTRASSRYDYEYSYYYAAYRPDTSKKKGAAPAEETGTAAAPEGAAAPTADAAAAPVDDAKNAAEPKGGRARHRGARRAARAAAKDAKAAAAKSASESASQSASETAAQSAAAPTATQPTTASAAVTPAAESFTPVAQVAAAQPQTEPGEQPAGDRASTPASAGIDDEFADEYDEYEDDDFYFGADQPTTARRVADDDTAELQPIAGGGEGSLDIDGQEELPLDERINSRTASGNGFDQRALDQALGVSGDDRR